MKEKNNPLYKAGVNKEVWKRILKTCFIIIGIRWIFSLIFVLWSNRIKTDFGISILWTFLWYNNFNNKYLEGAIALWSEKINLKDIKELPIDEEITLKPQSHNVTYYKIPRVGSATYDLELHVKWKVWWIYDEYIKENWPLDVKYAYNINRIFRGDHENDIDKCYLLRWRPRSNLRRDWIEFLDWENPNNCETIILNHLEWGLETEGYFAFVTPSDDLNNGKIKLEYRPFDWNRDE